MVLFNSFLSIFRLLIDDCCRTEELTELVGIKPALSKFADFLKESLIKIYKKISISYLELFIRDFSLIEVSDLESSTTRENFSSLGSNILRLSLGSSLERSTFTSQVSSWSTPFEWTLPPIFFASRSKESLPSLR